MAWKIERWLTEVFPGAENVTSAYMDLAPREAAIVIAASMDLALAELISKRLMPFPKEIEEFIGADADGRAPLGSFGARIQAGLLLGILTEWDVRLLRTLKAIRNICAHRVNVEFNSPLIAPLILSFIDPVEWKRHGVSAELSSADMDTLRKKVTESPIAGKAIIILIFAIYQAYFHRLSYMITPIPPMTFDFSKVPLLFQGRDSKESEKNE